jgi:hypothetical protein
MVGNGNQAGEVADLHCPQTSQINGLPIWKIDRRHRGVRLARLPTGRAYWLHIAVGSPQSLPDRIQKCGSPATGFSG